MKAASYSDTIVFIILNSWFPPDVDAQGDLTEHTQWARPVLCKGTEEMRNAISVINLQVALSD